MFVCLFVCLGTYDISDMESNPTITFTSDFDPSHPEAQQFLYDTCAMLKGADMIDVVRPDYTICPYIEFKEEYQEDYGFPVPSDKFLELWNEFLLDKGDNYDKLSGVVDERLAWVCIYISSL